MKVLFSYGMGDDKMKLPDKQIKKGKKRGNVSEVNCS